MTVRIHKIYDQKNEIRYKNETLIQSFIFLFEL